MENDCKNGDTGGFLPATCCPASSIKTLNIEHTAHHRKIRVLFTSLENPSQIRLICCTCLVLP